jgi:hypothetical protein
MNIIKVPCGVRECPKFITAKNVSRYRLQHAHKPQKTYKKWYCTLCSDWFTITQRRRHHQRKHPNEPYSLLPPRGHQDRPSAALPNAEEPVYYAHDDRSSVYGQDGNTLHDHDKTEARIPRAWAGETIIEESLNRICCTKRGSPGRVVLDTTMQVVLS